MREAAASVKAPAQRRQQAVQTLAGIIAKPLQKRGGLRGRKPVFQAGRAVHQQKAALPAFTQRQKGQPAGCISPCVFFC